MENSSVRPALPTGWTLRRRNLSGLRLIVAVTPEGVESLRIFTSEAEAIEAAVEAHAVDAAREARILRAARRFEREIEAIERREAAEAEAARS